MKINQFQPYARSERSVGDCTTETEVLSQDLRIEKDKTKKLEQQLKAEQTNLKNCLEKQPSTRSLLEPLIELLCKDDRDKIKEFEKQLEDQKKIVDITGREHAQLALNMSVCQKQLMNLSDSLQSAMLNSVEIKQNYESSLRAIQNKASDCQQDVTKTGEAVKVCQNEIATLKEDLKTSREHSAALATNLRENQNTARKEQAKLRSDMSIYQDAIMNCMKNTLNTAPGGKVNEILNCMSNAFKDKPYPGETVYTRYSVDRFGLSSLPNVNPLKPELGSVLNDVTSFEYPISIPSCPDVYGRRNIFIAVFSDPDQFQRRDNIRQTWAKDFNAWNRSVTGFAGFAFILGRTKDGTIQKRIEQENISNKDIIQIAMTDVYRNSSIKMAGFLNWMYRNCANFKGFILKVEDEVYLSVRTVEYFIHSYDPFRPQVFGKPYVNPYPIRSMILPYRGYSLRVAFVIYLGHPSCFVAL